MQGLEHPYIRVEFEKLFRSWKTATSSERIGLVSPLRERLSQIRSASIGTTNIAWRAILPLASQLLESGNRDSGQQILSRRPGLNEDLITCILELVIESLGFDSKALTKNATSATPAYFEEFTPWEFYLKGHEDHHEIAGKSSKENGTSSSMKKIQKIYINDQVQEVNFEGIIAHVISLCCNCAENEKYIVLRRTSLFALTCLAVRTSPPLLVAFLPGAVSSLARILRRSRLDHSSVVVAALDSFSVLVGNVLPLEKKKKSVSSSFAETLAEVQNDASVPSQEEDLDRDIPDIIDGNVRDDTGKRLAQGPKPVPKTFQMRRTAELLASVRKKVASMLQVVLSSPDSPSRHASPRVRCSLSSCLALLYCRLTMMEKSQSNPLLVALLALRADASPLVSRAAMEKVSNALQMGTISTKLLERILEDLMNEKQCGTKSNEGANGIHTNPGIAGRDEIWVKQVAGCLLSLMSFSSQEFLDITSRIGGDVVAHSIVDMAVLSQVSGSYSVKSIRGVTIEEVDEKPSPELEKITNEVLDAFGESGCGPFLLEHFLDLFRKGFAQVPHIISCIAAATAKYQKRQQEYKLLVFDVLKWLANPDEVQPVPQSDETDKVTLSRSSKIGCLRGINLILSSLREMYGCKLDTSLSLMLLIPLLRDTSAFDSSIREQAIKALENLAVSSGHKNVRDLYGRHLNFIMDHILREVDEKWAGYALMDIIRPASPEKKDALSSRAAELIADVLVAETMDIAGQNDARANGVLEVVGTIISASLKTQNGLECDTKLRTSDQKRRRNNPSMRAEYAQNKVCNKIISLIKHDDLKTDLEKKQVEHDTSAADKNTIGSERGHSLPEANKKDEIDEEGEKTILRYDERIADSALSGICDLLVGRNQSVMSRALHVGALSIELLGKRDVVNTLLPRVASIMKVLPNILLSKEFVTRSKRMQRWMRKRMRKEEMLVREVENLSSHVGVIRGACEMIEVVARFSGSFVRTRFESDIYLKLDRFVSLAGIFPTLASPGKTPLPSFAAMSVSDSVLSCLATISEEEPEALRKFSGKLIGDLGSLLDDERLPMMNHESSSKLHFEKERLKKRRKWARRIVRGLAVVDGDAVWIALAKLDFKKNRGSVNRCAPHESFHPLPFGSFQSGNIP